LKLKCDELVSNVAFNFILRRYIEASIDVETSSSASSSAGFQLAATVNLEATLPTSKALPPSDAPPSCATSTTWDWFPSRNLTGVGTGAALTPPLDVTGGAVQLDTIKNQVESAPGFSA
jgi:hypothetical protein